jgi:Undecaprenyl-phosphate glucose phosphotransferase
MANTYLQAIQDERELGYSAMGYVAGEAAAPLPGLNRLGGFEQLEELLNDLQPDEVISAIEMEDYQRTPQIIADCEKTGTKLSIIPFYADYIPSNPDFDDLNGIPLLNIRRIPLDNWGNAFCKRAMDIVGSLLLIILTSPVMLVCALGVLLSSPGPVIFKQRRIGRNKQPFDMYKFRSMRVNSQQETGWSSQHDDRKTKFGAFMRKCSLDEFPQFFNVLKGDMSLVGPRPEVPFYVDQFKDEIPLYMVKHQVRPGITGWAQVNGLRGDTSIKARVEHDIYYIEHWRLLFDLKILLITVFKGKFMNEEKLD